MASKYISSGRFKNDIVVLHGPLEKREKQFVSLSFTQFPKILKTELSALYDLYSTYDLPKLCGLRWSDFCSVAEHYDADADELQDEYGVESKVEIDLFLNTVEILDDAGYPFITVGDRGICIADDGLFWEIGVVLDNFEEFLRFLVHLDGASQGKKSLAEVRKEFGAAFDAFHDHSFLTRSIEKAEENESDANFENALSCEEVFDPKNLSFLFTGKLASMKRAEANERVAELGGKISKSVNKTLDVLVIGDDGSSLFGEGTKGSKQIKAEGMIEKGSAIKIISESLFLRL